LKEQKVGKMEKISNILTSTLIFAIMAISKVFSGSSRTTFFDLRGRAKALWGPAVG
jgi:hypothetical protein